MAFTDIIGQYLQNRVDTALQPFTDSEAYFRQRLLDDEEERRRREREEAERLQAEQQAAQQRAVEQAQQVQETVQQPQTPTGIAGMPQVAEMPGAAPVTGPVQPQPVAPVMGGPAPMVQDQANIEEQRRIEQAQAAQAAQAAQPAVPTGMPAAMPVAPVAPAQPQPQMAQQPQMAPQPVPQVQLPQPGPGVQVAGPAVAPPEPGVGVLRPPAGMVAPAPQPQPQLSFAERIAQAGQKLAGTVAQPQQESPWASQLEQGKNDITALGQLLASDAPEDIKSEAQDRLFNMRLDRKQQEKVDQLVAGVQRNDPKAVNDLTKELKSRREEGSLFKAILFSRLGLNKLAEEEQMKLGAGTTYTSFIGPDGQPYTVKVNGRGGVERAFDPTGQAVDETKLAELNAGYMGMKGAETGKQLYKDPDGNIWTFSTVPGRPGGIYTNTSTGRQSLTAPKGIMPLSYQNPLDKAAIGAAKQVMDKMRAENAKAVSQGANAPHSEEQIIAAGDAASAAMYQSRGVPGGSGVATPSAPAPAVPAAASSGLSESLLKKSSSGLRSREQQQRLWDESVAAGRPGKTAQGMDVARPGTSAHETGDALDFPPKSLTREDRLELARAGWFQPLGTDSVHWERIEKTKTPAPETKKPVSDAIERQAQAIFRGDVKAPRGIGSENYRMRAVMDRVNEIAAEQGRPFDPTLFDAREKTRKDFSGSGQSSKTVQAMNVAIDHLDTLREAGEALKNGDIPLFNKVANTFARNQGYKEVTDFNGIKSIVGSEVAKAVAGGQMALADREEIRRELDAALSPEQLNGVVVRLQQLLGGQLKGLRTNYESVGLTDFDRKLTPRTRAVLGGMESGPVAPALTPAEKARAELERRRKGQQ